MGTFRDLMAYKKAFALSMEIFWLTKSFPTEETYSLVDQIRRSSRSVLHVLRRLIKSGGTLIILLAS